MGVNAEKCVEFQPAKPKDGAELDEMDYYQLGAIVFGLIGMFFRVSDMTRDMLCVFEGVQLLLSKCAWDALVSLFDLNGLEHVCRHDS